MNEEFALASEAFHVLRDPSQRAEYDARLEAEAPDALGAVVDWVLAKGPDLWQGLRRGAVLKRLWSDRVYDFAFAGLPRLERFQQLEAPALVAVYSSMQRQTEALRASGRAFQQLCDGPLGEAYSCFVIDCSPLRRDRSNTCGFLSPAWRRVWRPHRRLAVIGSRIVALGAHPEAEAAKALDDSRDAVVLDVRRTEALAAFLHRNRGPPCRVVRLGEDYAPSRKLVALAHKFRKVAAFAEARASNGNIADALGVPRRFPAIVVAGKCPAPQVFHNEDQLNAWLDTYRHEPRDQFSRDHLSTLRSADLRRILASRGLRCLGCLEKDDFIATLLADAR